MSANPQTSITSVFIGGGTPSLFGAAHYDPLMAVIRERLLPGAEVTMEANPEDLVDGKILEGWRQVGINRLSIGVQTLDPKGREILTRSHSGEQSLRALELATSVFENTSADLIFAYPGQTVSSLEEDIGRLRSLGLKHLSIYSLTYEPGTVLGRKHKRGLIDAPEDDTWHSLYEAACGALIDWCHYEVSNWSQPGWASTHNRGYWSGRYYVAEGAGAHGYVPGPCGDMRYQVVKEPRLYVKWAKGGLLEPPLVSTERLSSGQQFIEAIACQIRTDMPLDLGKLETISGKAFEPSPILQRAVAEGAVQLNNGRLSLDPKEWVREVAWTMALQECFKVPRSKSLPDLDSAYPRC